ncbi:glycosyltransferase [Microbacterium sp.]|uniref:glycosyltransferase n=1 Tax=Microbacterium sp. TaxID=51671 RepID=UPI0025EF6F33|nr:glycosyltransferase [Microbacterium sp.]
MPARVHALLVVRPDGRVPADLHLQRTLAALREQSRPLDVLTIVLCGTDAVISRLAADSGAEGVIAADRRTSFAEAVSMGSRRIDGDAVWLLAQDTAPAPDALVRLAGALETAPSVAVAAPKLVRWDDAGQIVSLGTSMTALGRTVQLAEGELDQGQHDSREDVMGADARGLLVRTAAWRELDGIDAALAGADEGLDLGVRARLRGDRVAIVPGAVIAVAGDGVAGAPVSSAAWGRRAYAGRTAQLHRRLVYAPGPAVPLHWLSVLPLAFLRTLGHLLAKRPGQIGPEWASAATAVARLGPVQRARSRIRRTRRSSWAQLAPLRVTSSELRQRFDSDSSRAVGPGRSELRFFSGGGAWIFLAFLAVSIIVFTSLLTWPVLAGGALAPLRATVGQLWADAASGPRALGWATSGPADPFAALIAAIGSLWPAAPSRALVVLWILAMPLAALGGWFATTRVSERSGLRALGAAGWALAPMFLAALTEGRPTGVLVHLLLPWLVFTAAAAHRSWSAAAVASVIAVLVLACAPSLAPALLLLWVLAIVLTVTLRRGAGLGRVIWLLVPTAVIFAPLVWTRVRAGDPWSLLADPGVPLAPEARIDLVRRIFLAAGFPGTDAGGWAAATGSSAVWITLAVAPLLLLALLAPARGRLIPASVLLVTALVGLATATLAIGVVLSSDGTEPVGLWPGAALSLYWFGLLGAALTTLDLWRVRVRVRGSVAAAIVIVLAVAAVPALTAPLRGASALIEGSASTLPAYVAAEGRAGSDRATFVITPTSGGAVVDVVWGGTAALGGQSTLRSARTSPDAGDREAAQVAAALIADPEGDAVDRLAAHGVAFVMLGDDGSADSDDARELRIQAITSLDQRDDLEKVGETAKGLLWRVSAGVAERTAPSAVQQADAGRTAALQLGIVAVALLLAVPTRRSLTDARRWPRVIGIGAGRRR